jgi:hypothetical protein
VGEELRTDLAALGKSLFLASNTVSIVRSTGEDDDESSNSTGKKKNSNSRHNMASFAVMPDGNSSKLSLTHSITQSINPPTKSQQTKQVHQS